MSVQSHAEAVAMIVEVLTDGKRSDRYLRRNADGEYYTTPDRTFLTNSGPETHPYVKIPKADYGDPDHHGDALDQWAESLIDELEVDIAIDQSEAACDDL